MKKILMLISLFFILIITGCELTTNNVSRNNNQPQNNNPVNETGSNLEVMNETGSNLEVMNETGSNLDIMNETSLNPDNGLVGEIVGFEKFEDKNVGFSFQYPSTFKLLLSDESIDDFSKNYIRVEIKEMGEGDGPMDLSEEEEIQTVQELAAGKFGINHDFIYEPSKKVRPIAFLMGQDFMVLSRFEVCNVSLERKLVFFFNNKQISLTSYGPVDLLKKNMPNYFHQDLNNCGQEYIWNLEKQNEFYTTLENGNGDKQIQDWYNSYNDLVESIMFEHR